MHPHDFKNPPTVLPGLIVVDGPVGAGKTTLIQHLKEELEQGGCRVYVIEESIPTDLETYYRDPKTHAYEFQEKFISSLYDKWRDLIVKVDSPLTSHDFVICDRYWPSTRAFSRHHLEKGNITEEEYTKLQSHLNLCISLTPILPEYYLFVDRSNKDCYTNILKRGRPGESDRVYFDDVNECIRRYNCFPFFGEGPYTNDLMKNLREDALKYICPRPTIAKFAQTHVKCMHLFNVEENKTTALMLPDMTPINLGAELLKSRPINSSIREFLQQEAALIPSIKRPTDEVIKVNK